MGSAEYTASHASNTAFANDLYVNLLGRQADAGVASWIALLNAGMNREVVVTSFLRSQESAALAVDAFYAAYLNRPDASAGRSFWISQLADGQLTFSQVVCGFLESAENQVRAAAAVP